MIAALLLMVAMPMFAERVTPETARKVATTFLTNNGAKAAQLADLSKAAGFTNLYIFTAEDSFVVMSADDCVQPILGYSLTNRFVAEGMPENLRWWLQGYNDQIQDAKENALAASATAKAEWENLKNRHVSKATSDVIVNPLLSTTWDQDYPYNYFCPSASGGPGDHVYAGCVATATAQVLKYWDYPTTGNGSYTYTHPTYGEQTANFGETNYDWSNMPNSLSGSPSQTQIEAVAKLIYHCGVAVDMNYGTGGSGASSHKVQNALINYFKYAPSATYISRDGYETAKWIAFLKKELDEGRPMYYCGSNVNSGHAFVCDGYRSDDYFHFNWGWSGYDGSYGSTHGNNGYWAIGELSPGSGGSGSGSGTYNLSNAVIAWVEPISELTAPTLSAAEENGNIHLTWSSVSGVTSYDVYKDNMRITSINTCEYTDNDVAYGTEYLYYVRAIVSSDKSNPSNRVNIMLKQHNRVPSNPALSISNVDNSINLTWDAPETQSTSLYYGLGQIGAYYGDGTNTYWGQKYSTSKLNPYDGMSLNQISLYARVAGTYTLYLYKNNTSNELLAKEFEAQIGWNSVSFEAIPIDCSSDLWVIFHTTAKNPAVYGMYDGDDMEDAHYLFYDVTNLLSYTLQDDNISWPIKLNVTDGNFTYNIYRNNTEIETGHMSNSFTDLPTNNGNYEYCVRTCANNWVSEASESVSIDFSTMHTISDVVSINHDLVLSASNQYSINSTGCLTVTGTLSNDNPANLILEDGAQLIHSSSGVKATVKKSITPYTSSENGWHFIASPVTESITPSDGNGFLPDGSVYDLYYYEESAHHWRNYRANSFNLAYKQGYLYANNVSTTLQFAGTLTPSDNAVSINNLSHGATILNGFNLVGNPFACNATIDQDCYVISGRQVTKLAPTAKTFAPCEGAFIKATSDEYTVTFTKSGAKSNSNGACLDLVVTQGDNQSWKDGAPTGSTAFDRARVRLGKGIGMEKFDLNDGDDIRLTLWQNGQDFAVAYANGLDELPLNFKVAENGTYTLGIESNSLNLDYLHLIDNMTGADVDLLASPTYTFEAKATDYASRFRLVFSNKSICEDTDSDNAFAFISNGEIVINGASNDATLQIIDVTGRVVISTSIMSNVSTNGMPAGVYVLRLVTNNGVKTQKMIIE